MLRKRIYVPLAGLAVLGGAWSGAAQLATAAVDDPALAGRRVWCIDANGLPHYLPSPCTHYKGMWYFGNGANLTVPDSSPARTVSTTATVTVTPTPSPAAVKPVQLGLRVPSLSQIAGNTTKQVKLTVNSPAIQAVEIPGLNPYVPPAPGAEDLSFVWSANEQGWPAGTTVVVTPVRPVTGATTRTFTVAVTGFTGIKTFTLTLKAWSLV